MAKESMDNLGFSEENTLEAEQSVS